MSGAGFVFPGDPAWHQFRNLKLINFDIHS
jgi:hypothetical protein